MTDLKWVPFDLDNVQIIESTSIENLDNDSRM